MVGIRCALRDEAKLTVETRLPNVVGDGPGHFHREVFIGSQRAAALTGGDVERLVETLIRNAHRAGRPPFPWRTTAPALDYGLALPGEAAQRLLPTVEMRNVARGFLLWGKRTAGAALI